MSKTFKLIFSVVAVGAFAIGISSDVLAKTKAKLTVLHSFAGGADGSAPYATLVRDAKGNLYGTTFAGGSANLGTVFKIDKKGVETVLHTFTGGNDGAGPASGVIFGADGALYGATYEGGSSFGQGTVYKVTTSGSETVLHAFQGIYNNNHDGSAPYGGLVLASDGNMYGTTINGGSPSNNGTIYGVEPNGAVTVLYEFGTSSSVDGLNPYSNLIKYNYEGDEYLLGTTAFGGAAGDGATFSFLPPLEYSEGESLVGETSHGDDSRETKAGLVLVRNQTDALGTSIAGGKSGLGTIFLASSLGADDSAFSQYSFQGIQNNDGSYPYSALFSASDGNYYGTTLKGGNSSDSGTIYAFHFNKDGTANEAAVYRFSGSDGSLPYGAVIEGKPGTFYGTTSAGGAHNLGVVYKLVVKEK